MKNEQNQKRVEGKRDRERGSSLVEYSLLVALIAVACIGAVRTLGIRTFLIFNDASNSMAAGTVNG